MPVTGMLVATLPRSTRGYAPLTADEEHGMPDQVSAYIEATAARLAADGCEVRAENWSGTPVLIGYRSDFRVRWMATRLHLLNVVCPVLTVTATGIEAFTTGAMQYAIDQKGTMRGFQSGVGVLPCLVGQSVEPAAASWALEKQRLRFACMARPVVVDAVYGSVSCFRGTPVIGAIYAGHFRQKLNLYFPPSPTP
jgi:hypothetical protein